MWPRYFLAWRMFLEADIEDSLRNRRRRRKKAILRRLVDPISDLSEVEFVRKYGLSKDAVVYLDEVLTRETDLRSTQRMRSDLKILTALSFYVTGSYQRTVGEAKYLTQKCASTYIEQVTEALNHPNILKKFIQFPNPARREEIKNIFLEKYGIPGVIGCLDATHVKILRPDSETQHMFYCKKQYYSINVQMVCDSDCRIIAVNARYGGAARDAFILENSRLNGLMQALSQDDPSCWLLGDLGYPLQPWLMTPCSDPEPASPEANYNNIHSKAHSTIATTFRRLKNRWRCCLSHRLLHYAPQKCAKIINACCVLHNLALKFGVPDPDGELPAVEHFTRNEEHFTRNEEAWDLEDDAEYMKAQEIRSMLVKSLN